MRITSQAARSVRYSWLLALAGDAAPAASGQAEAIRMRESRTQSAIELMGGFAARTGITSDRPQQRYLWTDSFADEALEWDRDGQYFHYLTKWMHALDLVARSTRDSRFSRWARELAARAHAAFSYAPPGGERPRLYWKMSIDLSRPLVSSMGHHDPLDGFVTLVQLQATARALPATPSGPLLDRPIADLASMMQGRDWTTADPLGLGGLLMDGYRVQQLAQQGAPLRSELLEGLLTAALVGLSHYAQQGELRRSAATRLAFRELGLAIGLQAAERMSRAVTQGQESWRARPEVRKQLEGLLRYAPLRHEIETFWLEPEHRRARSWNEHRDINEVMLATSLAPDGCLLLPPLD